MMTCANIAVALIILPVALLFHDNDSLYMSIAVVVCVFAAIPVFGWLFEVFASSSERLKRNPQTANTETAQPD